MDFYSMFNVRVTQKKAFKGNRGIRNRTNRKHNKIADLRPTYEYFK